MARLKSKIGANGISIIEPSESHSDQPLWTLVSAVLVLNEKTKKPMSLIIPNGISWINDQVKTNQNDEIKTSTELGTQHDNHRHVVPPISAHDFVRESWPAFTAGPQTGRLNVNQFSLQHLAPKSIFGIGDVTTARYDRYSSCSLITGVDKVNLAEVKYDGKLY